MARWALRAPHYLNVVDTEYEYTEVSRSDGRSKRHRFKVPRFLHPDDPNDFTYPPDVTVCYDGKGLPRDLVFIGEPTPDMEPLDAEAVAISKSLEHKWLNAMSEAALPSTGGFSDALLSKFEAALTDVINRVGIPKAENQSLKGAGDDAIAKLQEQMAELIRKNAELEAKVNGTNFGPEPGDPIENELIEEIPTPPTDATENVRRI